MSSDAGLNEAFDAQVALLQYRDMARQIHNAVRPVGDSEVHNGAKAKRAEGELKEAEYAARLAKERAEATALTELKMRQEYEQKLAGIRAGVAGALRAFAGERDQYFAQVESEIVRLALSVAAKILHREAQVDPMLVTSLVRIAIERMREDSCVKVHVGPSRFAGWKKYFAEQAQLTRVEVVEDVKLTDQDCILETELGSANFGLDTQLKEVEQGFFDLLALRPTSR
jgi:flagellar assembly protein FliH